LASIYFDVGFGLCGVVVCGTGYVSNDAVKTLAFFWSVTRSLAIEKAI
jgi:hypothetical protein